MPDTPLALDDSDGDTSDPAADHGRRDHRSGEGSSDEASSSQTGAGAASPLHEPDALDRLCLAVDLRLTDLWRALDALELGERLEAFAGAARVAYARGYRDGDACLIHFLRTVAGLEPLGASGPPAPQDELDVELRLRDVYCAVVDRLTLDVDDAARLTSVLCAAYSRGFTDADESPFGPAPEADNALYLPDAA